jgi:hypothetical protein
MRWRSIVHVHRIKNIRGVVVQTDAPDWEPLETAIGSDTAGSFMWMHEIRLVDGSRVHAYKHVNTRRYLHLAEDGRAFDYRADSSYGEVRLSLALARALNRSR